MDFTNHTYMIMCEADSYVGSAKYTNWDSAVAQAVEYAANTNLKYYIVRIEGQTQQAEYVPPMPYVKDIYGFKYPE
jgi:hypothetical protein